MMRCCASLLLAHIARADNHSGIALPHSGDKCAALVTQLEAGQTDINQTEFREDWS
jgi:hypothetical protein